MKTLSMLLSLLFAFSSHFHFSRGQCERSITTVNGRRPCQGQQIFFDDFNSINSRIWKHEELIPWEPDYEFCYFEKSPDTSYIDGGRLVIKPQFVDDEFVSSGNLILPNCTGKINQECRRKASTYSIIPPVRSARLTTINSFAFKYGKIEITAKLPAGDWVIPELRLLPKRDSYGPFYESGMITIALSKGNKNLRSPSNVEIGSLVVSSSLHVSADSRNHKVRSRYASQSGDEPWNLRYHTYGIIWTPDNFQVITDGTVVADLIPPDLNGTLPLLMNFSQDESLKWPYGSKLAPFDKEFYISIGVSVGGVREFKDGSMSGDHEKPWKNLSPKNMATFWQGKSTWSRTWSDARTKMEIDKIIVKAL